MRERRPVDLTEIKNIHAVINMMLKAQIDVIEMCADKQKISETNKEEDEEDDEDEDEDDSDFEPVPKSIRVSMDSRARECNRY